MSTCLYCYQSLELGQMDFHPQCSKKVFGMAQPPLIDFDLKQLDEMGLTLLTQSKTVTGVQPKLSLRVNKHRHEPSKLTIVGMHGDYIVKPPSMTYRELPENEDLTMHLAEMVTIKTAKHSLIRLKSGELAYITQRFDRKKGKKIAVEDFCQLSENLTEHKYRGSIEKIGRIANSLTNNKGLEAQRLFEIVLFCYLIGNADMHLKNFSLIENEFGEIEFSPAYDLLNTSIVLPEDTEETALTINGKRNKITREDFDQLANSLNIHEKALQAMYGRFSTVKPMWIHWIQLSFLSAEMQKEYINCISERHGKLFS